jgi:hypothetical protein
VNGRGMPAGAFSSEMRCFTEVVVRPILISPGIASLIKMYTKLTLISPVL